MSAYRSHFIDRLGEDELGQNLKVAGWVGRIRDLGGITFIDLRDGRGTVQVVVDPARVSGASDLRMEYCVSVEGVLRLRPEGTENPDLATGSYEVEAQSLQVLSRAAPLPFMIDDRSHSEEQVRLRHRYLDLRRPRMAANLRARSKGISAIRRTLDQLGFLDVETPTLVNSTPEGARDFLVPSRLQPGHFYALPQSPQLFKQLLMVAGVERYYQIARCYRDEDTRADRQVEFTQLDLEGSFWEREDVFSTIEQVMAAVVRDLRGTELPLPLPRITYQESLARYGTDKPDLRFGMEIADLSGAFAETGFRGFAGVLESGGAVRGINIGNRNFSRARLDGLVEQTKQLGAAGLVWVVVKESAGWRSPVAKFLQSSEIAQVNHRLGAQSGDVLLLVADQATLASAVLGAFRLELGRPDRHDEIRFVWVVDFPVFETTDQGDLVPSHHPFTAPVSVQEMRHTPEKAVAQAYDLVLNGSELGSGSVRIHDPETQRTVFEILGISDEEAQSRFGWFLEALGYGTPPHAGFAVGIDRLVAILQNETSIREVIPFPKTQAGSDPMTTAPTRVADIQLEELGLDINAETKAALSQDDDPDSSHPKSE
ncbi:MAG: aspartate--tRNA ligase [Acidimicrobiia bacterium]|nr:aspartate--tRNA ligase [Acidimicrobiia bacterium]